jgi:hypothetical protein
MKHPAASCLRPFRFPFLACCIFTCLALPPLCAAKDYLTINSQPQGATVELNGVVVGKTPYSVEIPGGYLHGSKSVFGKLLRNQLHLKLTLEGYLSKELDLANGPTAWVALNGTNHGDYWILKTATFNFNLDKAATSFAGTVQATLSNTSSVTMGPALSTEDVVRRANPAVLFLSVRERVRRDGLRVPDKRFRSCGYQCARCSRSRQPHRSDGKRSEFSGKSGVRRPFARHRSTQTRRRQISSAKISAHSNSSTGKLSSCDGDAQ